MVLLWDSIINIDIKNPKIVHISQLAYVNMGAYIRRWANQWHGLSVLYIAVQISEGILFIHKVILDKGDDFGSYNNNRTTGMRRDGWRRLINPATKKSCHLKCA